MIEKSRLYLGLADRKDKYITFKANDRNAYKKIIMTLGVKVMLGECFECEGAKTWGRRPPYAGHKGQ